MEDLELSRDQKNQLSDIIERLESLTAEKKIAAEKIKAEYAEAASAGFDKAAIKQIVKDRLADADKTVALRRMVDVYRKALSTFASTPLGDWARQWIANDARHETRVQEPGPLEELMSGRKAAAKKSSEASSAPPTEPEPPADEPTDKPVKRESRRDSAKRTADKYINRQPPPAT